MAKRTVLVDTYAWMTPIEGRPGKFQHNSASRGDVIEVSDEEAARGEGIVIESGTLRFSALGSADDLAKLDGLVAASAPKPEGALSDEDLTALSVKALAEHVDLYPDDLDRVIELEQAKGDKARKSVLALADT